MKKLIVALVVLGVLFVGLGIAKNVLIKGAVKTGVKMATGLDLEIDSMDVGFANTLLAIDGLRLRNPRGFTDAYMVDLPEIYVDYNLGALLQKKVHLHEVRLHLNEFMVVTDASGKLNLDAFKPVSESKKPETAKADPRERAEKQPPVDFHIDRLSLKVGRVVVKDYSRGGDPRVREYNINIDREFTNVASAEKLALLVMTTALMPTGINLPGLDLAQLNSTALQGVSLLTGSARQVVGSAVGVAGDTAGTAAQAGKEVVGTATDAVEKTVDSFKRLVPFGN